MLLCFYDSKTGYNLAIVIFNRFIQLQCQSSHPFGCQSQVWSAVYVVKLTKRSALHINRCWRPLSFFRSSSWFMWFYVDCLLLPYVKLTGMIRHIIIVFFSEKKVPEFSYILTICSSSYSIQPMTFPIQNIV